MSFCSQLKDELCSIKESRCCLVAECYGLMLFGRSFSYREISIRTENKNIKERYVSHLKNNFALLPAIKQGGTKILNYTVKVDDTALCRRVMEAFGYTGLDRLSINSDVFKKDCCFGAFIRGAFLSCGQMSDPYKNYHTEFIVKDLSLALDFYNLLLGRGLSPKRSIRGNSVVIYFSNSETVEELLAIMGANQTVFQLIDVQIAKNIRSEENRRNNVDMRNIDKQVEASLLQRSAIDFLEKSGKLATLPEPLQNAAELRKNYPSASLLELCKYSNEPLTRSGINHRIKKLLDIARLNGFKK